MPSPLIIIQGYYILHKMNIRIIGTIDVKILYEMRLKNLNMI